MCQLLFTEKVNFDVIISTLVVLETFSSSISRPDELWRGELVLDEKDHFTLRREIGQSARLRNASRRRARVQQVQVVAGSSRRRVTTRG